MAKKKASAKKAKVSKTGKKVSSPKTKKIVKKAVSKSAGAAKKTATKKAVVKKTTKAAKKSLKKASKPVKKASSAKKAPGKAAPKKLALKKTASQKAGAKKAKVTKSPSSKKGAFETSYSAPVLKATARKKLDLSNFVTPLDDRIIIQPEAVEKMTPGGLYIPDTVSDMSGNLQGYVVAVGRGHMNKKGQVRPMDVQVGDKIIFNEYAGSRITIQNEDLIILREVEVMGVVSK